MTPQEHQLIDELFEKLSRLENTPRDSEAASAITQGLRRAPNATYALVQTVLVQDEALKRANARIQDLESGGVAPDQHNGGFLDTMRDALFGQNAQRGSVPPTGSRPVWNSGQVMQQDRYAPQQQPYSQPYAGQPYAQAQGGGGSFLGTAAAAAAGMVGGGLLLSSIRGMMGGGNHQAFGDSSAFGGQGGSPWNDSSSSDLARDADINNIGSGGGRFADDSRAGFFDNASNDDNSSDGDGDFGSDDFGGGDSDNA